MRNFHCVNPMLNTPDHVLRELGRKAAAQAMRRARTPEALKKAQERRDARNAKRAAISGESA